MVDKDLTIEPAPNGWTDLQLADLCDRVQESVQPVEGGRTPYVGLEHLASGAPVLLGQGVDGDVTSSKAGFRAGDVLFGKLRPYLRKGAQPSFDGICSTDILVFRAKDPGTPEYLKYLVHSDPFIEHAKATTSGVQHPRTSWSSLREFRLTLPPSPEQQRIAQVLSTVQQAIEQQERLIRTTTELKQALMQKLFTEGLRGEAQKETEIGLVPESWEVSTMGAEAAITKLAGYEYTKHIQYTDEGEIIAVRGMNLKDGMLDLTEVKRIWRDVSVALPRSQLHPGDVLLSYVGTVGSVAIITEDGKYHLAPNVAKLTSKDRKRLMPEYLLVYLRSDAGRSDLFRSVSKTSQPVISMARIRSLHLPLPSVGEQAAIVNTLSAVDGKLDAANRKRNAFQDLFRTLLHELMTGKVRVNTTTSP